MRRTLASSCCSLLLIAARATLWTVGPGQPYTLPSQVSTLVNDGDTVDIEAGSYPGDVARWQADDLVLRGVGGLAHLGSNGLSWGGKAIWVIQGDNATIEWIAFSECVVPDHNGAGIRLEGLNLTVRHCWFHHNENGILCGEYHPSTVRIEYSEFGHNGYGDGYSHNLYIGNIDSLIFRFNYSHHADVGHELKSRARVNVIEYNRIGNETDGTASREIDLPNGGQAYLIGNVIQQGPQSENSNIVGFGLEGLSDPGPHELYAVNNTIVNEKTTGSFFQAPADAYIKAYGNILAGGGSFMSAWPTSIDTLGNLRSTSITAVGFADAANYDFHIDEASPAHSHAYPAGVAPGGYPLVAWYEYVHPTGSVIRCQHATLDAGAFETCNTGSPIRISPQLELYPNPAFDRLNVEMPTHPRVREVMIIDQQGRVILRSNAPVQHRCQLSVIDLAPGPYTVRVTAMEDAWEQRFVKLP